MLTLFSKAVSMNVKCVWMERPRTISTTKLSIEISLGLEVWKKAVLLHF